MMLIRPTASQFLSELFRSALQAVNGDIAAAHHLKHHPVVDKVAVLAIGKAAAAMMRGADQVLKKQIQSALVITKAGHCDSSLHWPCLQAGHPVPDQHSLDAGIKLLEFLHNLPTTLHLLVLVSGGASALVEVLPEGMQLRDLQKLNQWLLASGFPIETMNRVRQSLSKIKGGKLLEHVGCNTITQLLISDVQSDDPAIIGSGLFVISDQGLALPKLPGDLGKFLQPSANRSSISVNTYIVANNEKACQAVIAEARKANVEATYHGQSLYGDVFALARSLAAELKQASAGIHVWGGETTLTLPDSPGRGGRNQSLALALALELQGIRGITVLVGASDGSDGPTEDAGAIIDGETVTRTEAFAGEAKQQLAAADAGRFLATAGVLLSTGPTGTNVMDLVIALKE